ncbi:autotransporter outer membrane beta-barrel domain-containing protein [Bartonella sp. HY329]|uniref:autotransporter outer membrane beta-barrel domain-containing protein n=1 Tax=unclassified Bartonella TaxID=2645622 RepID=UPI0021C740B3|nr:MULTISPECIES: autotransporter outer membrane beta-barrel domain-containing protein [unclassified Bartonella]UXM95381.1 autotransporter outer membrane beta-barrel domain-containing protein [Bartonella sp. HY329]UXN09706.1 autotransporter outer membrane beta-barrel domain-containing protein [Bartonella sp. HY328]
MLKTTQKFLSYLLLSSALVTIAGVQAQAQTNTNIKATELLMGFSQLNSTEAGRNALRENLETTLRINNQATAAERQQAIYDDTTGYLVGSLYNGLLAADALGPQLAQVYKDNNSVTERFQVTTFSPNFSKYMSAMSAIVVGGDSAVAKNYFANGSYDGNPDHPLTGITMPSDGIFNTYDVAYNPLPENANSVGDSRPLQVAPDRVVAFDGVNYFGKPVNTATNIFPGVSHNAAFPSGHSATGFVTTMSMAMMVPERYKEMMLRGSEYGNSRIVLGVHYAFDVIGARIHTLYALTQALNNNPDYLNSEVPGILGGRFALPSDFKALFDAAQQDLRNLLNEGCAGDLTLCTKTTDGFAQSLKDKEVYRYRLTYGLPTVGATNLDAVVPEGAEVLIANRFPYMSKEQLREVLATTEIQSGHALDNGSGYARLNLYDAADGYGAFNGLVTINMDSTKGGFNAYDTWGNNIGDYVAPSTGVTTQGSFTKNGTGMLELYGDNSWSGTTTINGGSLIFTGNSNLSGAMINNSTLSLTSINRPLPGHQLTVGSYHGGAGSVLEMATSFGGDQSATDMLHVTGDTSGTTALRVMRTGGEGAETLNGIKLIEVDGASNAQFTLANGDYITPEGKQSIILGIYGYSLYNSGGITGNDGNWYLRSHYQPAVPVYETYGQALLDLNAVSTYRERAGGRYFFDPYSAANNTAEAGKAGSLFWGRVEGGHRKFDPSRSTSGADHSTNMVKLEAGLDLLLSENSNGKLLGGIFVNYTNGSTKIDANVGDGKIKTDGYGFGANLTWIGENGFYVDGLAKMNWYNSDLDSNILQGLRSDNDGTGYALSIEAGRRFGLDNGWIITPQAQLSWSSVDFDDFTGPYNVRVSLDKAESLTARIGLGFERETIIKQQDGSQNKSNIYAIANIYQDFADGVKVKLNDKAFENRNQRTWGGVTIGANYSWNDDKYALFGEGTVKTSLQDFSDSYAIKGSVGFKVKW